MGLGFVLFIALGLAVLACLAAGLVVYAASRIKHRRLRLALVAGGCSIAVLGILPLGGTLSMLFRPQSSVDPLEAIAEVFPQPLPQGIQPVGAVRTRSSDWYSLHVAFKLEPESLEHLKASRNLHAEPNARNVTFRLPTSLDPPDFWPAQDCGGLLLYSQEAGSGPALPPPGTFDQIMLFYCPAEASAFLWAVDVD